MLRAAPAAARSAAAGAALSAGLPAPPAEVTRSDLSPAVAALPAASTSIDSETIYRRPYVTYGDIFRPVTGFNVSNYGQGALGYGIALRGYTEAEHGRDIAYFIDGVPVNDISSIHTPNYADLNILIPETVKNIDIVRGPFNVECGDFKSRRLRDDHDQALGTVREPERVGRLVGNRTRRRHLQQHGRDVRAVLRAGGLPRRRLPRQQLRQSLRLLQQS